MTKSGTQSLELAIRSLNLSSGSEVIIPSFGFVSLANAVVANSLTCVFADCEASTMNIDPDSVKKAISDKTKALICINYGGIPCDYQSLIPLCRNHDIVLIEDNAHGLLSGNENWECGTFGDIVCFSFDRLKNVSCYEGGAISFRSEDAFQNFVEMAELGTNRKKLESGEVSSYEWTTVGTNTKLAEPLEAILYHQFIKHDKIAASFLSSWNLYFSIIQKLNLPVHLMGSNDRISHNGYIFWLCAQDQVSANRLTRFLSSHGVDARFHYYPLHQSIYGKLVGRCTVSLEITERYASCLIRLPLYYGMKKEQIEFVCSLLAEFYEKDV
ncbi:MAG: aminotransferase class I/II-fold pyridoxal phosphate-dependent enzyme [Flavobacteriales bacterium]|nr:aminotransferase class I/II-fold pyridoxal phosphate-dependent enzyme [Flavobacteriales bacterium]